MPANASVSLAEGKLLGRGNTAQNGPGTVLWLPSCWNFISKSIYWELAPGTALTWDSVHCSGRYTLI